VKALSLWQPWASLVALGEKRIETREWSTKYRGPLAIHATAKLPPRWLGTSRESEAFTSELADVLNVRRDHVPAAMRKLPYGAVLCIVRLLDIQPTTSVREILSERERIFGNYEDGRYAWCFENVEKFDTPIPAKGNRMLWDWFWIGKAPYEI
jgi:activating signal cointegrator 1